jgi:hypothetical protein
MEAGSPSTQKKRRSSNTRKAVLLPEPDNPVTMTTGKTLERFTPHSCSRGSHRR